jgi:DNA-binding NarL/FixJ family response regulator
MTRAVALVADLMDRSRLSGIEGLDVTFVRTVAAMSAEVDAGSVDVVVVDLKRPDALDAIAAIAGRTRVVGFGAHVDTEGLRAARDAGADLVLARSAFFADPGRWLSR